MKLKDLALLSSTIPEDMLINMAIDALKRYQQNKEHKETVIPLIMMVYSIINKGKSLREIEEFADNFEKEAILMNELFKEDKS